jgi:quinol monooxygenase YgiN
MAATLFVRHNVADYSAWRSVYDSVEPLRSQFGCTDAEVMTDPNDRNDVFVIHRFPTLDQAQGFAASDELKAAMGRAGVAGAPRIEIVLGA